MFSVLMLCLICPLKFNIQSSIPVTPQSLVILIVATWFGWRIGVAAICIYIFSGAIGVPVFAGYDSGVEKLVGPTGGFFIGFLFSGFVAGILADKKYFQKPNGNLLLWFIGHFIILLIGACWFSFYNDEWLRMIKMIFPGAIIKILIGWFLTLLLFQIVKIKKDR